MSSRELVYLGERMDLNRAIVKSLVKSWKRIEPNIGDSKISGNLYDALSVNIDIDSGAESLQEFVECVNIIMSAFGQDGIITNPPVLMHSVITEREPTTLHKFDAPEMYKGWYMWLINSIPRVCIMTNCRTSSGVGIDFSVKVPKRFWHFELEAVGGQWIAFRKQPELEGLS